MKIKNENATKSTCDESSSLLAPKKLNHYRLRQNTAAMIITTAAGYACWFGWIGLRSSEVKLYLLCSIMCLVIGGVFLVLGLLCTLSALQHSAYCWAKFRFGWPCFLFALLMLPVFTLPCFFH